jgi:hypothetical protein
MILYHFTKPHHLQDEGTILEDGLIPSTGNDSLPPNCVVWLTEEEDYRWYEGLASERGNCRITLAIPSHDRRLVNHYKWLRKHAPHIIDLLRMCDCPCDHIAQMRRAWCYFGTVPPTYFRTIEYADPAKRLAFEQAGECEAA